MATNKACSRARTGIRRTTGIGIVTMVIAITGIAIDRVAGPMPMPVDPLDRGGRPSARDLWFCR
jgi:hypothetical protein